MLELIFCAVEDITAGDISRQQIGRKLDTLEFEPEHRWAGTARHQRFAKTRKILEQDVPACQHGGHHLEHGAFACTAPSTSITCRPSDETWEISCHSLLR